MKARCFPAYGRQELFNPSGGAITSVLLDKLENVCQYGKGWRAACPAHGGKSRSSLSIVQAEYGRILIHCFGGCSALDVVQAVGLELSDLFEKRITHATTPQERRDLREAARQARWKAALPVLVFETLVVLTAARQVARKKPLDEKDDARLAEAIERIESTRKVFDGR